MTDQSASDLLAPLLRWLRLHHDPVDLHLVCPGWERSLPVRGHAVVVRTETCAGRLPVSGYLELVLAGAGVLTLHAATCDCDAEPSEGSAPVGPGAFADAARLLRAAGRTETLIEDPAAIGEPSGTRRLRRSLGSPPLAAAELPTPRRALLTPGAVLSRASSAARPSAERERFGEVLAELALPAWGAGDDLVSQPPASAMLDVEGCTACGVCVRGCPTGSLSLSHLMGEGTASTRVLRQDVFACDACGRCAELCPQAAITDAGRHGWAALMNGAAPQLARCSTKRCQRCRVAFVPSEEGDLCPVCTYRRESPFGTVSVPPRAEATRSA